MEKTRLEAFSDFMGDYFTYPVSMFFFGICLAMVGISFYFLRLYLVKNPHLYKDNVDKEMQKKLLSKTVIGPVFYFIGGAVSFLSVYAAYLVFTAVPVYFVFFGTNRRK